MRRIGKQDRKIQKHALSFVAWKSSPHCVLLSGYTASLKTITNKRRASSYSNYNSKVGGLRESSGCRTPVMHNLVATHQSSLASISSHSRRSFEQQG